MKWRCAACGASFDLSPGDIASFEGEIPEAQEESGYHFNCPACSWMSDYDDNKDDGRDFKDGADHYDEDKATIHKHGVGHYYNRRRRRP